MKKFIPHGMVLISLIVSVGFTDKEAAFIGARGKYWAFQKVVRPEVPPVTDPWVRTPIDAFILDGLRAKNLHPSSALNRRELIRRVSFDLTGLPPTPAEVEAFVGDRSPEAYEKLVDRLLASPHYGERWALKWLDVVRYADTNGFELDQDRPHAWRYRDYVIDAFNRDKPYDRFIRRADRRRRDVPRRQTRPSSRPVTCARAPNMWWRATSTPRRAGRRC